MKVSVFQHCNNAGKGNLLTFYEFVVINRRLREISYTWADLWSFLYYLPVGVGRLIGLRYTDIRGEYLTLQRTGRFKETKILIPASIDEILHRRALTYPDDIFIFQSHSNRVKAIEVPVTVIAFNMALKKAAAGVTDKTVSSKSARLK
ncbi:hypothetical protein ACSFCW_17730 [Yokenella regensburgei]|uniref:hypothetical protein n=1 Tax=Yokenella regensburgei TaxID=158877 RepID=UPI003ED93560